MTTIVDFIQLYENNRDHYLSIESHVENVCKENLRKNKVNFLWQSRVKALDSLAEKLNGRRNVYQNEADNVADIKDLVGARILLLRLDDAPLVERVISENFDIRNETQHPKTGAVSSHERFRGYDAHHFYVTRRGLPGEQHNDPIIEIQVISVVMWTWATLNHDIEYKVLKGDQPKSVHSALEALLGLANVTAVVTGLVEDLLCSDPKSPLRQQDNLSADVAMDIRDFLIENRDQLYSKPDAPSGLSGSPSRLVGDKDLIDRISFLKWISPIDFDAAQQAVLFQRWPGTGTWLYENSFFQDWFLSRKSRVLWCKGTPGSGKSVLSSGVIDYIRNKHAQEESVGVAFAYFRYYLAEVQRPENILTAFVKELCRRMKQVPIGLLDSFRFHSQNDTRPDFQACVEQFDLAVRNFKEVFIIIDALDECENEAKRLILDLIWDATRKFPCIKFFVASRPENDIKEYFEDLRVPIVEVRAQKDIKIYLKSRIDQLTAPLGKSGKPRAQRLRIKSAMTKDEVFQALVGRAEGLFLWAKLQLDNLCLQRNEKDIKTELYSIPKGLHETYSRIMKQIEEQPEALRRIGMKCLIWVLNARRPLHLFELKDAVAVDEGQDKFEDLTKTRKLYTFEDLIDSCRNLLVPQVFNPDNPLTGSEIVRPLHYTVQKFLDQRHMSVLSKQEYPLQDSTLDSNELAKSCLIYLELACVDIMEDDDRKLFNDRWVQRSWLYPFVDYCSEYFDDHFIDAPTMTPDLLDRARSLLSMSDRALGYLLRLRQKGRHNFDELYKAVNAKTVVILTHLYEVPWLLSNAEWSNFRVHPLALHWVCADGYHAGVNRLLATDLDPNAENSSGEAPLAIVTKSRNLISSPTRQPEWNQTRISLARLLLDHGAQPNKETRSVRPAITTSATMGDIEFVKMLLEFKVDLNGVDSHHPNALYTASRKGHDDIAKLLLQHGALPSIEALVEAAEHENQELVDLMLAQGLDVNATDYEDRTRLYELPGLVPKWELDDFSRARLGKPYQPDQYLLTSNWGFKDEYVGSPGSALLKAARCGCMDAVEMLIKRGAHIQGSGLDETPILAAAAALGRGRLVQLLLAGGADPDRKDPEGGTPLLRAIGLCSHPLDIQLVDLLLQVGANVNGRECTDSEILSVSPLHVAALVGSAQIVKILIQRGADVNASGWVETDYKFKLFGINRNYAKRTALQIACTDSRHLRAPWHARLEIIRELLKAGAEVNANNEHGITALQLACTYGGDGDEAMQIFELLLRSGADANANGFDSIIDSSAMTFEDSYGYFALLWHPPENNRSCLDKSLLGVPPVHRASFRGYEEILAMLLAAGADVHIQGYLGTAIEAAYIGYYKGTSTKRRGAWAKVIGILRQKGALEPGQDRHIGVRCKGPLCKEKEWSNSLDLQYGGRSKWISGDRYKCVNCMYNLCAGCKDWFDRNYDEDDYDTNLENIFDWEFCLPLGNTHRMIKLTVREELVDR